MATTIDRSAFDFMREHAGYIVGRRALGAYQLARAEEAYRAHAEAGEVRFVWEEEQEPYDAGDIDEREAAELVEVYGNYWVALQRRAPLCPTCGRGGEWETVASLGSVVGDSNYHRVVEAELALEAGLID